MATDSDSRYLVCPVCGAQKPKLSGGADGREPNGARCAHDGAVFIETSALKLLPQAPLLGVMLNENYAIFDVIGRGGMGAVYKAVHVRLNRVVAVKSVIIDTSNPDEIEDLRARFVAEARALSKLRHPGIVTVYDYGEFDGVLYMVLEFIHGVSLWHLLKRDGPLPAERAVPIVNSLLEALDAPHQVGLVHRDIKPSNVMLEMSGGKERVVLIDFGIAKQQEGRTPDTSAPKTRTGVVVGTPKYMAPEQLRGEPLTPRTAHYAVACLFYKMVSGRAPFRGSSAEVAASHLRDGPPLLPRKLRLHEFDPVLSKAMSKDPKDRFADNRELGAALLDAWVRSVGSNHVRITAPIPRLDTVPNIRIEQESVAESTIREGPSASLTRPGFLDDEPTETSHTSWKGAVANTGRHQSSERPFGWAVASLSIALLMLAGLMVAGLLRGGDEVTQSVSTVSPSPSPSQSARDAMTQQVSQTVAAIDAGRGASVHTDSGTPVEEPVAKQPATQREESPQEVAKLAVKRVRPTRSRVQRTTKRAAARSRIRTRPKAGSRSASEDGSGTEVLIKRLSKHLAKCRCEKAKTVIRSLDKLDKKAAADQEERYKVRCSVIGRGCLSEQ